jgi:hypothetical protein
LVGEAAAGCHLPRGSTWLHVFNVAAQTGATKQPES